MSNALQPLPQTNRDATLDLLRGFALAGVLLTFCITDVGAGANYQNTILDDIIDWPKYLLVENRMYTTLIIVFGIGFYVQLEKARQKNVSITPPFTRRLLGLLLIGFAHAIILSTRDVLMFYGMAGLLLLPMRNLSNRWLVAVMAFIFIVAIPLVAIVADGYQVFRFPKPNNYIDHLQHNWKVFTLYHQIYPIYFEMLFHFMLGFIIGRTGFLQKITTDRILRRKLLIGSLIAAAILIPVAFFWLPTLFRQFVTGMPYMWQRVAVATGYRTIWQVLMIICVTLYATSLISLWRTKTGKNLLMPLATFGQMTLSNYLIQSIILVPYLLLFDKFDNLPPFSGFILFLIVLALQLVFSAWWMTRYTMGPFEWLLRSFTYWKWQKIKKPVPNENEINTFLLSKTINHL